MKHTMRTPCKHCPFRKNIKGYLRKARVVEIVHSVLRGEQFPCHKTTRESEDDDGFSNRITTDESSQCAGAEIFAAHHGQSSQLRRIAGLLGAKVAKLNMLAKVCRSLPEMVKVHCGDEVDDGEFCEVCNSNCLAPAGYQCATGVIEGVETVTTTCSDCGRFVCEACSTVDGGVRICDECQEIDE